MIFPVIVPNMVTPPPVATQVVQRLPAKFTSNVINLQT